MPRLGWCPCRAAGVAAGEPTHHGEEARDIIEAARRAGALSWDTFAPGWWRLVRRVVLGDRARDDDRATEMLMRLRRDANWAFLKPKRRRPRAQLHAELAERLAKAEPGSLAARIAAAPSSGKPATSLP